MSHKISSHDLESQQILLLPVIEAPIHPLRRCILVTQAAVLFMSRTDKMSISLSGASSSTVIDTLATGDNDSEQIRIAEILPTSPHVSLDVNPEGNNSPNTKHQHSNIAKIVKAKDLHALYAFGGVQGFAEALDTDLENGIPGDDEDLCFRRIASTIAKRQDPGQSSFRLLLKSSNNYIILLLLLSAALSIGFGIMEEGTATGWYEGAVTIFAVIVLVVVPSARDFWYQSLQKFHGMQKLSKKSEMAVDVFRGGCQQKIPIFDILLGDIVCLERECQVPADGIFISGDFIELDDGLESIIDEQNPFLFYGSKVTNGKGRMLVTSVGANTAWGQMMSRVTQDPNKTPLHAQLDKVNTQTQITGLTISIIILVVLFLRFKLGKENDESGRPELKGKPAASKELLDAIKRIVMKPSGKLSILTTSLTILLVGIVEVLPFAVALSITYWNKKTLCHKALVQDLSACINMGLVTTILTDKIGELSLNSMEVDKCWIGEEVISEDFVIAPEISEVLCDGISTLVLIPKSLCSSTDESNSIISWASLKLGMKKMKILKESDIIVQTNRVNFNKEESGVLIRKNGDKETNMHLHWKGPATTILAMCSRYYDSKGTIKDMDENKRTFFERDIELMQSKNLKTIAFAYKQTEVPVLEENNLILIGLLCLKHACWGETNKAMEDFRNAGVNIILVSEDDVMELEAIASKCGILLPNSDVVVLRGEEFRKCSDAERMNMVDRIAIMGKSLPSDRLLLVKCLKQKGHMVAVVGVKTTETPALKEGDVGLAMGTLSTKMARESSDIYIWDGNFSFLVTIVTCGRCAYENIRKYIQHNLTMAIAGLLINSIATVSLGDAPITVIQLVWANLIVSVLGGLGLLIEPPHKKLKAKPPVSRTEPLVNKIMWRNICTQAVYQATVLLTFLYKGQAILGTNQNISKVMIFNSFVLCQVFNQFNARELERKNVFKGIHHNYWFWVAVGFSMLLQAMFVEIARILADSARLNCEQWAVCFLIGTGSWVIHLTGKCTWEFIENWISMVTSAPLESTSNLELPLIKEEFTAITSSF